MFRTYGVFTVVLCLLALTAGLIFYKNKPMMAFASDQTGNGDILIVDRRGRLTNLTQSPTGEWAPCWSPDGKRLAYTGHQADQADIWIVTPEDGTDASNLTDHPAWDYSPTWSPDGRKIVFVSERDGDAELFVQAIDGKEATQLTYNTHQDRLPDWSPAGNTIAFAAVTNGAEQIYLLDLSKGNEISPLLPNADLSGTNPVWHPDGKQLAFVGWRSSNRISIYLAGPDIGDLRELYTDTAWIGSLNWSADGNWLLFTGRANTNHDLFALNVKSGEVAQLTGRSAWDDFPALHPNASFKPQLLASDEPAAVEKQFGYGVNLADLSNAYLIQDMHFNAIKGYINWATIETEPGQFRWVDPDNVMHAAQGANADVLLRVHGTPDWARPADTPQSHPPTNLGDFGTFLSALAARYRGQVIAYEIWNEPNLNYEWGYKNPDPGEYATLLKTAYQAIKAQDPDALVISAGPSPTGDGNPPETLGDLDFINGMYQAGAKGYFDALGSHIYAGSYPPDFTGPNNITFDRVVRQHEIMLKYDDADTPVWITEMGWNLQTHWDLGEYHNQGVSQLTQAEYIRRAYEKIETEWPWTKAAYLFNLDFSRAPWYAANEQMRWYAILNPDRTPRPAFTALRLYHEEIR